MTFIVARSSQVIAKAFPRTNHLLSAMNTERIIFGILLIASLFVVIEPELLIYVNQDSGQDDPCCLHTGTSLNHSACRSLSYVAAHLGANSMRLTIKIQSDLKLGGLVSFANSTLLSVEGEGRNLREVSSANNSLECGLQFINITNLTISGVRLSGCEANLSHMYVAIERTASLHVHQSLNVCVSDIQIDSIKGTGLVLSDVHGHNSIEYSNFTNNTDQTQKPVCNNKFAGGLLVQFSANKRGSLVVRNCSFTNNTEPHSVTIVPHSLPGLSSMYGYGTGGGMSVIFMGAAQGVKVLVQDCLFANNVAYSGAGMYVHFQDSATSNHVFVRDSIFRNNSAVVGGGLAIGIDRSILVDHRVMVNSISVVNTTFVKNIAHYGGGTALFAVHSDSNTTGVVLFSNCSWTLNEAFYSPAVDISPYRYDKYNQGYLPSPVFSDCNFTQNMIIPRHNISSHSYDSNIQHRSTGVFVITRFMVVFEGELCFRNNKYTALLLTSASVSLKPCTFLTFHGNQGVKGGAIALYGFSVLKGAENCKLTFDNNNASKVGGAIFYQPIEQRELIEGKSCFIQYVGKRIAETQRPNLTFVFQNNTAILGGTSIFASSFYSCFYSLLDNLRTTNLTDFFDKIGDFEFRDSQPQMPALASEGNYFVADHKGAALAAVPGQPLSISLELLDELNHTVRTPLNLLISNRNSSEIEHHYFVGNKSQIILHGHRRDILSLVFNTQGIRDVYYEYANVTLQDCPPGYSFDSGNLVCVCSAFNTTTKFKGIDCNTSNFTAFVSSEYWAGYLSEFNNNLYTAHCTFQACAFKSIHVSKIRLPSSFSPVKLNERVCGDTKTGILCGKCNDNVSAYAHSSSFKCGPEDMCKYGPIFVFLSEIVPVIILFSLIIHYDVSLTSGGVAGFVFFSQMVMIQPLNVEILEYDSYNGNSEWFKILQTGHNLVYSILNFDFFCIEKLSFCLWHRANVMDVLAVKYFTTSFTLVLIYVLVRIMNSRWSMRRYRRNEPRSVVHGLSAFLVLSYAHCASVTFKILSWTSIRSNTVATQSVIRVAKYGGLIYFEKRHLFYAIPALFFLVFFVLIPPLLLLAYPLGLQLLSLCNLSEHPLTLAVLRVMQTPRLVPLFDAFQSCFKDRFRSFAGLYFLYKILILVSHSLTYNLKDYLVVSLVIIVIMLCAHAMAQPYREKMHNIIDALLLLNLAVIWVLVLSHGGRKYFMTKCVIQTILMYIPIFGALVWCVVLIVKRRKTQGYQHLESFHSIEDTRDDSTDNE